MEVQFQNNDEEEDTLLYESVVEEIALEGLDGITIQALLERLVDREGAPINRHENHKVVTAIWNSIKKDLRLSFYLLPQPRPDLDIWNRNLHVDDKGKFIEPFDATSDIYLYKSIEILEDELPKRHVVDQRSLVGEFTSNQLSDVEIHRIQIRSNNKCQEKSDAIVLEGIRFFTNSLSTKKNARDANNARQSSKSKKNPTANLHCSSGRDIVTNESISRVKNRAGTEFEVDDEARDEATGGSTDSLVAVRGSCPNYDSRIDISQLLRSRNVTFFRAVKMFENRLVVVASQFLRESLLLSQMNQVKLNGMKYSVVERVGRARHYGEQARGKVSLVTMNIDPKIQFYIRKKLLEDGVISKQPLIMKFPNQRTGTLISVFHLPHFFRRVESSESINIRKMFAYICSGPEKMCEYFKLQAVFGKYLMRTLSEDYQDLITVKEISYASLHPEEYENEPKTTRKEALIKRKVRVIGLQNPGVGLRHIIYKQLAKSAGVTDDDEGPSSLVPNDGHSQGDEFDTFDWDYCYSPERELAHEFELTRLLRLIISRGNKGATQQEISRFMNITNLDARSACRYLTRWKYVKTIQETVHKTKVNRLIYWKCEGPSKVKPKEEKDPIAITILSDPSLPVEDNLSTEVKVTITEVPTILATSLTPVPVKDTVWKSRRKFAPVKIDTPTLTNSEICEPSTSVLRPKTVKSKKKPTKSSSHESPTPTKIPSNQVYATKSKVTSNTDPTSKLPRKRVLASNSSLHYSSSKNDDSPRQKRSKLHFDDIDGHALAQLKKQRNEWSAEEDALLIIAFITTIVFIPRYNLDRIFIYNAVQIRDVLHQHAPETKSKTTSAVRRRLHNILRNSSAYSKYRSLLSAALCDEIFYSTYVEKHLPTPNLIIFHKVPQQGLSEAFSYLKAKFLDTNSTSSNSLEMLTTSKLGDLMDARELRRMEAIWTDVWGAVFWNFYRRKKPESLTSTAEKEKVTKLETEGIVIEEPIWSFPHTPFVTPTMEDLPISKYNDDELEFTFEVSMSLLNTATNLQYNTNDEELFDSSSDTDDETIKPEQDDVIIHSTPTTITLAAKSTNRYASNICGCSRDARTSTDVSLWTARTATMSILVGGGGSGSVDNFKRLDSFMAGVSDDALEKTLNSFRSLGIICLLKATRTFSLAANVKRKLFSILSPATFRVSHALLNDLQKKTGPKKISNGIQLSDYDHVGGAYLLTEIISYTNLTPQLPKSIITVNEEWRDEYQSILKTSSSNVAMCKEEFALRLLRLKLNADNVKGRYVEKDFFDINLPQLNVVAKSDISLPAIIQDSNPIPRPPNEKTYLENKLVQLVEVDGSGETELEDMALGRYTSVYKIIAVTGETGVSIHFLNKHFDRDFINEALSYLIDCNYVYLVGIRHRKFVASAFMKKWTSLIPGTHPKRVVMRPWLDTKGEVNWRLIDRSFVSIIGILQRYPYIHVEVLSHRLIPLLSHVEVVILLSTLVHLGIISIFKFSPSPSQDSFNLFSKWKPLDEDEDIETAFKDYNVSELVEFDQVYIEAMPFYISKYTRIQQRILPMERITDVSSLEEDFLNFNAKEDETEQLSFDQEDIEVDLMRPDADEDDDEDEDDEPDDEIFL